MKQTNTCRLSGDITTYQLFHIDYTYTVQCGAIKSKLITAVSLFVYLLVPVADWPGDTVTGMGGASHHAP